MLCSLHSNQYACMTHNRCSITIPNRCAIVVVSIMVLLLQSVQNCLSHTSNSYLLTPQEATCNSRVNYPLHPQDEDTDF